MTEGGDILILGYQFILLVTSEPTAVGIRRAGSLSNSVPRNKEKEKIEDVQKQE